MNLVQYVVFAQCQISCDFESEFTRKVALRTTELSELVLGKSNSEFELFRVLLN